MSIAAAAKAEAATEQAEGLATIQETYQRADREGVAIVDGWGISLRVDKHALVISDGLGPHRRERRFDRATHGLRRVVVVASAGAISLDALTWLDRLNVPLTVLDGTTMRPSFVSAPKGTDDARLRRMQAAAPNGPVGTEIARCLLGAKLRGQGDNLRHHLGRVDLAREVEVLRRALVDASDPEVARDIEASAAAIYWSAWAGNDAAVVRFTKADAKRLPEHWHRFDTRRSVLTAANGNRNAERPVNALLNFLFALLEVECVLACWAVGLDPGLGVVHADTRGRQSMALDLMEAVRPLVEEWVLRLLAGRTFKKSDFHERHDGSVRIMAPLSHQLSETLPLWREKIGPYAEQVAHILGDAIEGKYIAATPLSRAASRRAAAEVKTRHASRRAAAQSSRSPRQRPAGKRPAAPYSCPDCGGAVTNPRRVRCEACIAKDPRQTPQLRQSRARAISSRRQAEAGWSAHHPAGPVDTTWARETLLPALAGVKLSAICAATSCPKASASGWRNGRHVPHPMHWAALATLVGVELPGEATC